jgi:N-acetyl-anhydromuramyl-L-alanine amidase AmpD
MLHYDDSTSDVSAVEWLTSDKRCKVSYNWLVLDNGKVVEVAPETGRAWHAGVCRPSRVDLKYKDANSFFYGIAIAAGGKKNDKITKAQLDGLCELIAMLFKHNKWTLSDTWRISSHHLEAWPRGRKIDIIGSDKANPVYTLPMVLNNLKNYL